MEDHEQLHGFFRDDRTPLIQNSCLSPVFVFYAAKMMTTQKKSPVF